MLAFRKGVGLMKIDASVECQESTDMDRSAFFLKCRTHRHKSGTCTLRVAFLQDKRL
jgi:hypothetical protein